MDSVDYINPEDGLLYCGKCNTPKQCRVSLFGVVRIQSCICDCEQKRLATEKEAFDKQQAIAEKQRQESTNRAKCKKVDLVLKMQNGGHGRITGSIKN